MAQHVGVSTSPLYIVAGPRLGRALVGLTRHQQLLLDIGVEILWVQGGACGLVHAERAS